MEQVNQVKPVGLENKIDKNKVQIIKNKSLLALAYKIIDHFPNFTLFGSIVREIIAPAIISNKDPFDDYESTYDLPDIDLIYSNELDKNELDKKNIENKQEKLHKDTEINKIYKIQNSSGSYLIHKLREWDWICNHKVLIKNYDVNGITLCIKNKIYGFEAKIDIIYPQKTNLDFDVNRFQFNKEKGLYLATYNDSFTLKQKIKNNKDYLQLLAMIKNKECNILFDLNIEDKCYGCDPYDNNYNCRCLAQRQKNQNHRFVKMLKKGWNILNKNHNIKVHYDDSINVCNICHENPKDTYIELNCSKCILCFDCFEILLLKSRNYPKFKCPTCRIEIIPWIQD
jgi:hypothetical protein